jgi:G3E family GTPase
MLDLFPSKQAGQFGRRLRRERGARIPVTIVTGFLGAGKTTIVRRFLESPEGYGTAVIVNEFGAVGIDDALVRASSDETVLLGNGCLCCTTRTDLQVAIRTLISERERGAIPSFARILIETSGLADPGPILQTFATDRALGTECFVEVVVTVVDAVSGLATLDWSAEARKQAILADHLVASKTDLADDTTTQQLFARLRELNPHAAIDVAVGGNIDPRCLLAADSSAENNDKSEFGHHGFVAEAVHTDDIRSFVISDPAPIRWTAFEQAMKALIELRGPDLLRVKGFLNVEGCRGPVLVQFVQHFAHPPVELDSWPSDMDGNRLVFITRNISEQQVRDLFDAVRNLIDVKNKPST